MNSNSDGRDWDIDPTKRLEQLYDIANQIEIDDAVPLRRYFGAGMHMLKMSKDHCDEGELEKSYIYLVRFIKLFVSVMSKPGFSEMSVPEKTLISEKVKEVFPKAESYKMKIKAKYEKQYAEYQKKKAEEGTMARQNRESTQPTAKNDQNSSPSFVLYQSMLRDQQSNAYSMNDKSSKLNANQIGYPSSAGSLQRVKGDKTALNGVEPESIISNSASLAVPAVDRSTKPKTTTSLFGLQDGLLRTVVIPYEIFETFLALAIGNTKKSVETCGILAGEFKRNSLVISHLIIPKQTGTSDSCTTQNEEELITAQVQHDVVTLGWIHTHPTQTAFLSSVDLHTQCSYQCLLSESIAIVCAPKFDTNAIFSLTKYGLDTIRDCSESGFHMHQKEPPLFQKSEHIEIDDQLTVRVIDLR